jgi:hypothetical protein
MKWFLEIAETSKEMENSIDDEIVFLPLLKIVI